VKLKHLAQINPATPAFDRLAPDADIPFVPLEAVWRSGFDGTQTRTKAAVSTGYTRFVDGDIVLPKITPTFQADRATIVCGLSGVVAAGSTELHVIRVGPQADTRFVRYLLSSRDFLHGGTAQMLGVAGQKRVPDQWLREFPVHVTDLSVQRVIANYLDNETARIDALVDKIASLVIRLQERRALIHLLAVQGALTSPDAALGRSTVPGLPEIPEHWRDAPLKLVARLGSGHTPSRGHPEWWTDCQIPWITTGEVSQMRSDRIEYIAETRERISELGLRNSAAELHPAGTVVLSRTASAGYSAIMKTDMATSQDFVTWTCGPLLDRRYLLLCLRAMRSDLLERLAQGSTHKTIYMPDINRIRVPLPLIDEQREIAARTWQLLGQVDHLTDKLVVQQRLLRERRQAIVTAAVTGQLSNRGAA
jgi:type I restriction enzyme S subunit